MGQNVSNFKSYKDRQVKEKPAIEIAQEAMHNAGIPTALANAVLRDPEAVKMIAQGR